MRIGVVGGGVSGLATAWMLSEEHRVVLYEAEEALGGNARSILVGDPGSTCWATPGATHVLPGAYPLTVRLLRNLSVDVLRLPIGMSVLDEERHVRWASPRKQRLGGVAERGDTAGWARLLAGAWRLERRGDWSQTWDSFVDRIGGPSRFLEEVGIPVVAGFWGARPSQIGPLSARALLAYLSRQTPGATSWSPGWPVVCLDGTGRLVEALSAGLAGVDVRLGAKVEALGCYGSSVVVEQAGSREVFDRVVLAVPPWEAAALLGDVALPGMRLVGKTPTLIALHADESLLPEDPSLRSPVMVVVGEDRSQLTTVVGHAGRTPVYRSWVTWGAGPETEVLSVASYGHVAPTPELFALQRAIRAWQGTGGCWLAGSWTHDVDSLESALYSALVAATGLDRSVARVRWLGGSLSL